MAAALARGHEVTLFNRGNNPEVFPDVEQLRGDRNGDLSALEGRSWNAVLDTSGYVPRIVRASAELLQDAVNHYTFISTISVYAEQTKPYLKEDDALATLKDETLETVTGETYGGLKVRCETVIQEVYGPRALIIRPGLVVGPHDPTDRFTYWLVRADEGGEVLAPVGPELPVQFIDARDLAEWTLGMLEAKEAGTYNAVTPAGRFSMGELLETCRKVAGSDARFTWVDEGFLLEREVKPFTELPLWIPGENVNFSKVDSARARAKGLSVRGLEQTVADTLAWYRSAHPGRPLNAGLSREREQALLEAWQQRH